MSLGQILKEKRGNESRLSFAKKLQLSYTFVRSLEEGLRYPSDDVLVGIAQRLDLDPKQLILEAYCDRSPILREAITSLMRHVDAPGHPSAEDANRSTEVPHDRVSPDMGESNESSAGAD